MKPHKEEIDIFIQNIKMSYDKMKEDVFKPGTDIGNNIESRDFVLSWKIHCKDSREQNMLGLEGSEGGDE